MGLLGAIGLALSLAVLAGLVLRLAAAIASLVRAPSPPLRDRPRLGRTTAHRGGRISAPENTLEAFRHSVQHVDSLEFDVWLTRDNHVVVFHDGDLDRMCGFKGHVNDFNYLDLPAVRKRPSLGFPQGAENGDIPDKVRIPLLSEVLDLVCHDEHAHVSVLIEFKQHSPQLVHSVFKLLHDRNLLEDDRVIWFSLKADINKLLYSIAPAVPRAPSVMDVALYVLAYRFNLLALFRMPVQAFAVSTGEMQEMIGFTEKVPGIRDLPLSFRVGLVNWYSKILRDPGLFEAIRNRGIECFILGVNSEEDLDFARAMGAQSVISDDPEWLAASSWCVADE